MLPAFNLHIKFTFSIHQCNIKIISAFVPLLLNWQTFKAQSLCKHWLPHRANHHCLLQ